MKEKKFISAEQTPVPGYVGEVQAETTSDSISGAPDIDIDSETKKRPDFSKDPAFEWNPQEALAPVANPALAPSPSFAPWGQTMPQGVGALPNPEPLREPVREPVVQPSPNLAPWGQTMPQGVGSLPNVAKPLGRSIGAEPITNAIKEPVAPNHKVSDFFGDLSAAATGGKVGVEGSVETLKRIGMSGESAYNVVKGTQALGLAEAAVLTAASPVGAKVASDVKNLSEVASKGAQSLSMLDRARALLGGAY